ncbi:SAM-dependent chlorinase/fluorinase [Thermodesulfobacteriota bacterium]
MKIIVSCCDWTDVAQAETEIAALKHAPEGTRFISVPVATFSALNCSFIVWLMADALPENAVIIASADPRAPGVPREPIAIYFKPKNICLICPNIGIATLMMERYEPEKAIRLYFDEWDRSVFNGRDIYAPTAGRVVNGCSLEELGETFPLSSIYRLTIDRGKVLHVDNYGNVKLYAFDDLTDLEYLIVNGRRLPVVVNHKLKSGETVPGGTLVVTNGSSFGLVELQVKAEREGAIGAAEILGLSVGDSVEISAH